MLSFDRLCSQKVNFTRLSGVKLEDFKKIVEQARPDWAKMQQKKKVSGRNSHLRTLEDEILLVLIFYRFYVTHEFLGYLFGLDNSNICRHLWKVEPLLAKNLAIKKDRTLTAEDLTRIMVDVTEINTQRPSKKQRAYYSGKKKRHTSKIEVQINEKGRIINVSKSYGGRKHDFAIRKSEKPLPRTAIILADSGYQGLQKKNKNAILPHKKKRKTPLTEEEKAHNRELASQRSLIENVFAKLKRFKILSSVYRNFQKKLHLRFNVIAGIHNLAFL
jgi:transposase